MEKDRILLLGLGNDIIGDDAVGLVVARELQQRFGTELDVVEAPVAGFTVLDLFRNYDKVLVVDSICTSQATVGSVREFSPEDFQQHVSFSPHYIGLHDVLELARKLEIPLPSEIRIVAMEVSDPFVLREGLSFEITAHVPELVDTAASVLRSWGCTPQKPATPVQ
jgi:hydrogenase maturation protease